MTSGVNAIVAAFFLVLVVSAGGSVCRASGDAAQQPPCGFVGSDCASGPRLAFTGGEASLDALVDKMFQALEKKDLEELEKLRVTQDEYQQIVAAGAFKPGEKPKLYSPQVQKYFWEDLNYKSHLYAKNLVRDFGGRTFASRKVRFSKPSPQKYGWYETYGELRVDLETPPSVPEELQTGTIVEFQGHYKFIGFGYD
jgi:hypothetical protein